MLGLGLTLPWVKHSYRRLVVADVPYNSPIFRYSYGTPRKFANLIRARRAYRRHQLNFVGNPVEIRVDPTNVCNLKCPLCPTGAGEYARKSGMMSVQTFSDILERHYRDIFNVKLFVWGEPTLNPNLPVMVDMATRHGVGTEICSNLSRRLDDSMIEDLVRAGLTWLTVSLDGTTAETYSRYRRGGDFTQIEDNVRRIAACRARLRRRTPFLEWQMVPFQHNEHQIDGLLDKARDWGMDGARIKPLRLDKTRGDAGTPIMAQKKRDWSPQDGALAHVQEPGVAMLNMHCVFLWYQMAYHHDGGVAPCCEVYGSVNDFDRLDVDLHTTWQGETYVRARRAALGLPSSTDGEDYDPVESCRKCRVFSKPDAL